MKNYRLVFVLPVLLILMSLRPVNPQSYHLDIAKSTVKWTGYAEAGTYAPSGTIQAKSGSMYSDGLNLISGKVTIDMLTLSQDNKEMETHLRGSDFFDSAKYPESTFVITALKGTMATGNLTIKGITNQVTFPVNISKSSNGYLIKALIKVDRTKFEIKYNSKSYFQDIGNYAIKNDFDLNVSLQFN